MTLLKSIKMKNHHPLGEDVTKITLLLGRVIQGLFGGLSIILVLISNLSQAQNKVQGAEII